MKDNITALEAKFEAQKIAFGPIYFQVALALKQFGLFELIGKSKKGVSIEELKSRIPLSLYSIGVLLDAAESASMVFRQDGNYKLTKIGYMLHSDKMTEMNLNFVNDVCYSGAKHLSDSLQTGKPEGLKVFGNWPTVYEGLSELPVNVKKSWFDFDHFYSDDAFPEALKIVFRSNPGSIYDIGGNTGKWAMACCAYHPQVKVTIIDLPGQLTVAEKNIEKENLGRRVAFYPTDILDAQQVIPDGADIIWMSQFLDCFSPEQILLILGKVRKSSSPQTKIFILEPFIDNQKFEAARYCLTGTSLYFTCIANGNSKMYRTSEMMQLIQQSGLKVVTQFPLIGNSYHTILECQIS